MSSPLGFMSKAKTSTRSGVLVSVFIPLFNVSSLPQVVNALMASSVNEPEKPALPQLYPPKEMVVGGIRTKAQILQEEQRASQIAKRRSKRLSANLEDAGDVLAVANHHHRDNHGNARFTANFLSGALDISSEADDASEDHLRTATGEYKV